MKKMVLIKMNNKKRISLVLIMLMMAVAMAGCGDKKKEESLTKNTEENSITENTDEQNGIGSDTDDSQLGEFDFSQVFDNIEVNGEKVPFPFCLNDLGEGYEIRSATTMKDGICTASLFHNEELIAYIFLKEDEAENVNSQSLITGFTIYSNDKQEITVNKIDCDNNESDIEEIFEDLPKIVDEDVDYKINENGNILWFSVENNEIKTIKVRKGN